MTGEEYDAWSERSVREYAADIATSRDLDLEAAAAQSAGEFAQLLPDGLASPDMHLWTAVVDDEPVGSAGSSCGSARRECRPGSSTSASTRPVGVRVWAAGCWRRSTTPLAGSGPRR